MRNSVIAFCRNDPVRVSHFVFIKFDHVTGEGGMAVNEILILVLDDGYAKSSPIAHCNIARLLFVISLMNFGFIFLQAEVGIMCDFFYKVCPFVSLLKCTGVINRRGAVVSYF
jgi:hypothetical protein